MDIKPSTGVFEDEGYFVNMCIYGLISPSGQGKRLMGKMLLVTITVSITSI